MTRTKNTDLINEIKTISKKEIENPQALDPKILIPSGSTMLNLACSDCSNGAFVPGTMVNLIGDKSAGKTMLYHTMLAEVARRKRFSDYRLIHRDIEAGVVWDVESLFGSKMAKRMENDVKIETIEDFKKDIKECLAEGRPFIYGLDSYDSLSSEEEEKKKAEKETGYSGAKKTKEFGALLRGIVRELKKTGSLLVVISQVRENLDAGLYGQRFYRTGGKSLGHHCSHEVWLFKGMKLKREVQKRKRAVGIVSMPCVEKNRLTGKARKTEFPIYYDYGIDDISSMVNFLIQEGFWKKKGSLYTSSLLGIKGSKTEIIDQIEKENLEKELRKETELAWKEIEDSMKLNRKKRFQ